jgi:cation diffusion facilitator family transporter
VLGRLFIKAIIFENMESDYTIEQINAVIKSRRSIYPHQYEQGKIIPGEIIRQILENATRAPNHKQTEPWRFKVYSGEGLNYFANLQAFIYKQYSGNSFKEGRYKKLLEYPLQSSHVIAIGMKRNEKNILPEIEEIEAVACAVENMFLTVTAYGLGAYWTTAGITYMEAAKPYFELGPEDKLLGFFYMGYVAKPYLTPSKRNPVETRVQWINKNSNEPDAPPFIKKQNESVQEEEEEHEHDHDTDLKETKTRWVVILTVATMILEIVFGYYANSMALTAEGWHMSTHVFAIGLTWLAYFIARKYSTSERISFQKDKLLSLSGFTSAIVLQIIAVIMAVESVRRLIHPLPIKFSEAIMVAVIGLIVNSISAKLLHHEYHGHSDHNIRAAYLHVLADGLTSLTAIIALSLGLYFHIYWLDSLSGLIGSVVITSWAVQLIKGSGSGLIEFKRK